MIIISDTSPISNLQRIRQLALLQKLYGRVMLPPIVYAEIRALETFGIDISGLSDADWMIVQPVRDQAFVASLQTELDPGEAEAIALSIELQANRLLIDERLGRQVAQRLGLKVTGLLGVLVAAKQDNLITELKPMLDELIPKAKFRVHPDLPSNFAGRQRKRLRDHRFAINWQERRPSSCGNAIRNPCRHQSDRWRDRYDQRTAIARQLSHKVTFALPPQLANHDTTLSTVLICKSPFKSQTTSNKSSPSEPANSTSP